jgi:hypothetical protein
MYDYLRQHPQVFMPFHKEPLFFGSDLTHRYGRMHPNEYRALFAGARHDQRVGEASAWYLYSETAAAEIAQAAPDASIIVMLRNPVDVMHAQHSQLLFNRQEDIQDFGQALSAEEARMRGERLPPGPIRVENLFYRRMVRFAEQLERYLECFGRDRVHVIIHDDLKSDTASIYRGTLEFLGVDPEFLARLDPSNENKLVRHQLLQNLIWNPPFLGRAIPILRRHPLAHRVRARLLALNSRTVKRRPVDPDLRAQLNVELGPEVARLSKLLERDLSHWVAEKA